MTVEFSFLYLFIMIFTLNGDNDRQCRNFNYFESLKYSGVSVLLRDRPDPVL